MKDGLKKAIAEHGLQLMRSLREGDGCVIEADEKLNNSARAVIVAMKEEHGEAWLGKVNLYGEERHGGHPVMWAWAGELVYNFGCAFVAPRYDAELVRLIRERDDAPYTGTKEDKTRLDAILVRQQEIGAANLVWS